MVGSWHSHPSSGGGSILPSTQDIREAERIKMPYLCILNEQKTACYKVDGVKAAQGPGPLTTLAMLLQGRRK